MGDNCGFYQTDIMLPAFHNNSEAMSKWSCVACDQYTSQPEYWKAVQKLVKDNPSTLNLMLPEIYLNEAKERMPQIFANMKKSAKSGVFETIYNGALYVKRTLANGKVRRGFVAALDLEIYDFSEGSKSLCRPTEKTVAERLPARVDIRKQAALEMPHIMLLIDDKEHTVVEALDSYIENSEVVYDFDLMQNGGHITGYRVINEFIRTSYDAIKTLLENSTDKDPLLFAVGDGNHSLAAAKIYYENLKAELGEKAKDHPARYVLCELVNLYDEALEFEPIHRVFFGCDANKLVAELKATYGVVEGKADGQVFTLVIGDSAREFTITKPDSALTVGTIQNFLDKYEQKYGGNTDYIHGEDTVMSLCKQGGDRVGFIVDAIKKDNFFDVIKKDGVLPRKTFSMGNANDKRFYLECRKITPDREMYAKIGKQVAFLKTSPENARNGEGSFVRLKDGRIMYAYNYYIGSNYADDAKADLYAVYSADEGETWTEPSLLLAHDETAQNYMSPSLVRMDDGNIGMLFNRKEVTPKMTECMPYFTTSGDEGKTWSKPVVCAVKNGYYCAINDGLVKLKSGRIMMALSSHHTYKEDYNYSGSVVVIVYSDDNGKTWQRLDSVLRSPFGDPTGLQEPGLYEFEDGKLWLYFRTAYGFQYESFSTDGGKTWTDPVPNFNFSSPDSPMRIKRFGDITLSVFNPQPYTCMLDKISSSGTPRRSPFVCAVSYDDGKVFDAKGKTFSGFGLWEFKKSICVLEDDPENAFCYPAMIDVKDGILIAYYHSNNSGHTLDSAKIIKVSYDEI